MHINTHICTRKHKYNFGSEPDINDVPAAFNNYLFIKGVIL